MEAGADLEQRAHAPLEHDPSLGGRGDARQDLEQGRLAGAVVPDDSYHLARSDVEGDVPQRPDHVVGLVAIIEARQPLQPSQVAQRGAHPAEQGTAHRVGTLLLGADAVDLGQALDANGGRVGHQ